MIYKVLGLGLSLVSSVSGFTQCSSNYCVYFEPLETYTYSQADQYCFDTYGTRLASFHGQDDFQEVHVMMALPGACPPIDKWWVGAKHDKYKDTWTDDDYLNKDGRPFDYAPWADGEGGKSDAGKCVVTWPPDPGPGDFPPQLPPYLFEDNEIGQRRCLDSVACIACNRQAYPTPAPTPRPTESPTISTDSPTGAPSAPTPGPTDSSYDFFYTVYYDILTQGEEQTEEQIIADNWDGVKTALKKKYDVDLTEDDSELTMRIDSFDVQTNDEDKYVDSLEAIRDDTTNFEKKVNKENGDELTIEVTGISEDDGNTLNSGSGDTTGLVGWFKNTDPVVVVLVVIACLAGLCCLMLCAASVSSKRKKDAAYARRQKIRMQMREEKRAQLEAQRQENGGLINSNGLPATQTNIVKSQSSSNRSGGGYRGGGIAAATAAHRQSSLRAQNSYRMNSKPTHVQSAWEKKSMNQNQGGQVAAAAMAGHSHKKSNARGFAKKKEINPNYGGANSDHLEDDRYSVAAPPPRRPISPHTVPAPPAYSSGGGAGESRSGKYRRTEHDEHDEKDPMARRAGDDPFADAYSTGGDHLQAERGGMDLESVNGSQMSEAKPSEGVYTHQIDMNPGGGLNENDDDESSSSDSTSSISGGDEDGGMNQDGGGKGPPNPPVQVYQGPGAGVPPPPQHPPQFGGISSVFQSPDDGNMNWRE